jgi:hypothetical protein
MEASEQVVRDTVEATLILRARHHVVVARLIESADKRSTLDAYSAFVEALDAAIDAIAKGHAYIVAADPTLTAEQHKKMRQSSDNFISVWSEKQRELEASLIQHRIVHIDDTNSWMQ